VAKADIRFGCSGARTWRPAILVYLEASAVRTMVSGLAAVMEETDARNPRCPP
jgi:hypothetical protein